MERIEIIWLSAIGSIMAGILISWIIGSNLLYWSLIIILILSWIISELAIIKERKSREKDPGS